MSAWALSAVPLVAAAGVAALTLSGTFGAAGAPGVRCEPAAPAPA